MKTFKSIIILMAGMLMIGAVSSCKQELENVVPQDALSTRLALQNPGAMQTLYQGVYADFRSYAGTFFELGEMRSDIWTDGLFTESANAGYAVYYDQNISENSVPASNWARFYELIYQINNVIDLLPQSTLSQDQINKELSEMYGLRAYVYYTMSRTWGGVPLVTKPIRQINKPKDTYQARAPKDSVMMQIKSDIAKSLSLNADLTIPSGKRVYWNPVATLTLKGDVYIWSGTLMGGGSQDLQTALKALQKVEGTEGSNLHLDANYADIFNPNKKADNPEIIFAVNYEYSQDQNGIFNDMLVNSIAATSLTFAINNDTTTTVSDVYPNVGGANRVGFNQAMIDTLMAVPSDQRIANTFRVMYRKIGNHYSTAGILLTKYIGSSSGAFQIYNNDYPIYRYAYVLLLAAEAKAKLGMDPSAEINKIRERAYGANYAPFVNGSIKDNMDAILREGLKGFIGEGKRWWDLRRAGDQFVFDHINPNYLSPATVSSGKGPTLELPISRGMINDNPKLKQTPGY